MGGEPVPEFERKALPFQLKADAAGTFSAVFATLNVIDHDGDVTVPGAFKDGAEVIVGSWGHKTYELPVGKGVIRAGQTEAAVDGEFFLDTQPGKDTYQTVKNLGSLGEWSYVFQVNKQSFGTQGDRPVRFLEGIDVYSVDPVLAGAGIDTRTTVIKGLTRPFDEESAALLADITAFIERAKARAGMRATEGRPLSPANRESLKQHVDALAVLRGELETALASGETKTNELERQYLRFQRIKAGLPA